MKAVLAVLAVLAAALAAYVILIYAWAPPPCCPAPNPAHVTPTPWPTRTR